VEQKRPSFSEEIRDERKNKTVEKGGALELQRKKKKKNRGKIEFRVTPELFNR